MKAKRTLSVLCLSVLSVPLWAQSPAATPSAPATSGSEIQQLKDRIAEQEQELKKLQDSLAEQRTMLEQVTKPQPAPQTAAAPASTSADIVPVLDTGKPKSTAWAGQKPEMTSPLSIAIGNSTFTPLGFVDATFFGRSTNVGSGIGTNFAGIPFGNTAAGHLSESNFSTQNSRVGFRVDSNVMGWKVLGYLEADFLFNNNANSYQITSNSAGFRLRNYFVDTQKGGFEFLAGQDWSLLTPNRKGLSPIPSDIFYSQNMDTNYQAGLIWSRQTQFRFVAHPSENVAFGVSLENPQQYIGGGSGASLVTLPSAIGTGVGSQFQSGNSVAGVPNLMPDIIAKLALDGHPGDRAMHLEFAGLLRGFKDYIAPTTIASGTSTAVASTISQGSHSKIGAGVSINANVELVKNFRLVTNNFYSDGGGRYIFGMAPDFIVRPNGELSLVHSASTVDGFEAQVAKNTQLDVYYGGTWIGKDLTYDYTAAKPGYVGYGLAGQNRDVQEITFDWVQTLWKSKSYGALSLINQYSYLFREPWSVASGTPAKAHTNMYWVNVRYTLP